MRVVKSIYLTMCILLLSSVSYAVLVSGAGTSGASGKSQLVSSQTEDADTNSSTSTSQGRGTMTIRSSPRRVREGSNEKGAEVKTREFGKPRSKHPLSVDPRADSPVVKTVTGPDTMEGKQLFHGKVRSSKIQVSGNATSTGSVTVTGSPQSSAD